ncbi:uncharacterized protein AC631_04934 [Debaryomyces fabryi]|uniref:Conserved oligomeric Golgi complex subunit 2 n=1 Tax=Debaryomyces fabryi TaxID=58627 RepID=A0A0V1PT30_9ASCO|nr:uncharacterized protein AC631_04934 [Debaryomyces fabryi]KRZ99311.1 hypothetical protein AC631_04934 [Debaryomyces fabryi]CUM46429.1 unnamed protein product [Debaryomyces fabryi]
MSGPDYQLNYINGEEFPYPVTINREDFQQELNCDNFQVDDFLYQNHRFTSIDSLIKDLTHLLDSLNNELLDLVNNDYTDFIKLGKSINGGLQLMHNIQIDLQNFNTSLSLVKKNFQVSNDLVANALAKKQELVELKTKIKLCLLLNDHVNNFENILNLDDLNTENDKLVTKLKTLTALYLSLSKLFALITSNERDDSVSFVNKNLKVKIMSLKFEFKGYLDEMLTSFKSKRISNRDVILELLNIYKITGHERDFISIMNSKLTSI